MIDTTYKFFDKIANGKRPGPRAGSFFWLDLAGDRINNRGFSQLIQNEQRMVVTQNSSENISSDRSDAGLANSSTIENKRVGLIGLVK